MVIAALVVAATVTGLVVTSGGLSSQQKRDVAAAEAAIASNGREGSVDEVRAAVGRLIDVFRADPDAEYDGRSMPEVLDEASSDLRPHFPDLAARLELEQDRLLWERDRGKAPWMPEYRHRDRQPPSCTPDLGRNGLALSRRDKS